MAGFSIAVQQHDGLAAAGGGIVEPDAGDLGEFASRRRLRKSLARIEQGHDHGRQRDRADGTKYSDRGLHPVFPFKLKTAFNNSAGSDRYAASFGSTDRTALHRHNTIPILPADHSPR